MQQINQHVSLKEKIYMYLSPDRLDIYKTKENILLVEAGDGVDHQCKTRLTTQEQD